VWRWPVLVLLSSVPLFITAVNFTPRRQSQFDVTCARRRHSLGDGLWPTAWAPRCEIPEVDSRSTVAGDAAGT
jgi:hypothetical protein